VLVKGSAQVVSPDGNIIFATLEEGSFFGEIALIHAIPRTATVRAVTRCELLSLRKVDFEPLLEEFPELNRAFTTEARKRMAANKANNTSALSAAADAAAARGGGASNPSMAALGAAAAVRAASDSDDSEIRPLQISRSISFSRLGPTESVWSEEDDWR
jgi:CRP-like cAMP-binding protein